MESCENSLLKNKISIGLSLDMSVEEYLDIFDKYEGYIHSLYFSPPLSGKYHSRQLIEQQFEDPQVVERFYKILELSKAKGILLDCVLNRPSISDADVKRAVEYLKGIDVDQITCLQKDIDVIHEEFFEKELIYSYNNDLTPEKIETISSKFTSVVVGKYFLRSPKLLKRICDDGFKLKLLVNNGCSFNCKGCQSGTMQCKETFDKNISKHDLNYLYALQSLYPNERLELLSYINLPIESIKISNRTDGYEYLDKCLDSYINMVDPQCFINEKTSNFRLWSRLGWFNSLFDCLDNKEIVKIKQKGFK